MDIDLGTQGLGRITGSIEGTVSNDARVQYGILVKGKPYGRGYLNALGTAREFEILNRLPGTYRVWLEQSDGRLVASRDVIVRRGEVAEVLLTVR